MGHDLPTPPIDDAKHIKRPGIKTSKPQARISKRHSIASPESISVGHQDGRHKRVWKACERCRMKKTKCDGESPCKRCKDDGLVCTAGSRKKTEFKQLPKGYAEVLENTQYALIATVQKLYTMVRNGESWDLGEPEMNDRGMPVIHDIAEKLGCIRPSPDLPCAFPEDPHEFAALQEQMALGSKEESEDESMRKMSQDSLMSNMQRTDRASSSESDHSILSREYSRIGWHAQQESKPAHTTDQITPPLEQPLFGSEFKQDPSAGMTLNPASSMYANFKTSGVESPTRQTDSPFSPWSACGDDFLGPAHMLDLTALYMRQNQHSSYSPSAPLPQSNLTKTTPASITTDSIGMQVDLNTFLGPNCTIQPNMLDCRTAFDVSSSMDTMMYVDYDTPGII